MICHHWPAHLSRCAQAAQGDVCKQGRATSSPRLALSPEASFLGEGGRGGAGPQHSNHSWWTVSPNDPQCTDLWGSSWWLWVLSFIFPYYHRGWCFAARLGRLRHKHCKAVYWVVARTKCYIGYERNARQKMSELQTAPKMCVLCTTAYTSPEWLCLKLLSALRKSHLTTLHPQGNNYFITWALGHGSFLKTKLNSI